MKGASRNVITSVAVLVVILIVSAQVYVGYKILSKKEILLRVESLGNVHYGEKIYVEGYVVKYRDNETVSYILQGQNALRAQTRTGLVLLGRSYDPYTAYVWDDRYRNIHTQKALVNGVMLNGTLEVSRIEIS